MQGLDHFCSIYIWTICSIVRSLLNHLTSKAQFLLYSPEQPIYLCYFHSNVNQICWRNSECLKVLLYIHKTHIIYASELYIKRGGWNDNSNILLFAHPHGVRLASIILHLISWVFSLLSSMFPETPLISPWNHCGNYAETTRRAAIPYFTGKAKTKEYI